MSSTTGTPHPIVFTFPESVFGRRLTRYLNLRNIPHTQIRVPPNLPRPILTRLNIIHRRIPILSLGRSIYIDTRLILSKLETLIPNSQAHPTLGATDPFSKAVETLLEGWVIDAGPFWRASGCLPPTAPLLQSDVWMQDRADGSGGAFTAEGQAANRAWAISQLRVFFDVAEGMLGDGRDWLLGGSRPGLAELHAWVFDWIVNIADDMFVPKELVEEAMKDVRATLNEREFPRTLAWVRRFREYVDDVERENASNVESLEGEKAEEEIVNRILGSELCENGDLPFEDGDVLGLRKGQMVSVGPTDFGFTHADVGVLVGLAKNEVVIEVDSNNKQQGKLRLHFPRIGFKTLPVEEDSEKTPARL